MMDFDKHHNIDILGTSIAISGIKLSRKRTDGKSDKYQMNYNYKDTESRHFVRVLIKVHSLIAYFTLSF